MWPVWSTLFRTLVLLLPRLIQVDTVPVGQSATQTGPPSLSPPAAQRCFETARAICERDAGRLWGVSLCGPILIADRETRTVIANQADRAGHLKPRGDVFVGRLPDDVIIAATAGEWAGVHWTMLPWPLPDDEQETRHIIAHELWHRIQGQLGLPGCSPPNDHLDTRDGRTWLRLEWRALREALTRTGQQRVLAVTDALAFRAYRRSLCPGAADTERAMEMHEGLAEYTGVRLSADERDAMRSCYRGHIDHAAAA